MSVIYHGDCLEMLNSIENNSIDAIITDPPYSSGGLHIGERNKAPSDKYLESKIHADFTGDNRDQRSWTHWMTLWASLAVEKLKPGGYFLTFTDWRQLPSTSDVLQMAGITWRGVVVWDKGNGTRAPHKGYFRHQAEYIVWGSKGKLPKAEHAGPYPGVIKEPVKPQEKLHMTGKPVPLMEQLVAIVPPGGVILDPFMGSAYTGVACQNTGRHFFGIEKDDHYFEVARKRLNKSA